MEILSIKTCGIDQRKYYFDTYWLAGMDILSTQHCFVTPNRRVSRTIFAIDEVVLELESWISVKSKKKCLFPVGGHCRMHSLYWLDFSDFRQETHFQRRLDQFWNPRTRWGSNLVFKTTFCPKPWREIRIEAFGSDGKPLDGSKSLTEAIHQWHNWFPLMRFSYSVSI